MGHECGGQLRQPDQTASRRSWGQLTPEQMFDTFAININGLGMVPMWPSIARSRTGHQLPELTLRHGVLVYRKTPADESAAAAINSRTTSAAGVAAGDSDSPGLRSSGRRRAASILALVDRPDPSFDIVSP